MQGPVIGNVARTTSKMLAVSEMVSLSISLNEMITRYCCFFELTSDDALPSEVESEEMLSTSPKVEDGLTLASDDVGDVEKPSTRTKLISIDD